MSRVISEFSAYPWDRWSDGKKRRIVRGKDFDATVSGMRATLRYQASQRGCRLVTRVPSDGVIEFQFVHKEARNARAVPKSR